MNLFELQENLKNFSQDQLVREMRNPTGTAPQYLVLSELQRRRRIMQEEQAQMPQQASVAEEAVAAAGMPQGGLAQMAQAMAPQTDMTQNTARMAEGGKVRRMQPGGLAGISSDLSDFMPTEMQATVNQFLDRNRLRGGFGDNPEYDYNSFLDEMGLSDSPDARDAFRRYQDRMNAQYALEGPQNDPSLFMPGIDRAPEEISISDISSELEAFSPEGTTEIGSSPLLRAPSSPDRLSVDAAATANPASEEEYLLRNILANSEAAIARDSAAVPAFADRRAPDFVSAMPPDGLPSIPEDINRARFADIPAGALPMNESRLRTPASSYDEVPFARAPLPQPDLRDEDRARRTAEYNARTLAADAQRMGTTLPREPVDRTPMTMEEAAAGEFSGLPESMTSPYYDQTTPRTPGIGLGDIAEAAGRGVFGDPAVDAIIESQRAAADREAAAEDAIRPEDRGFGRGMDIAEQEAGLTFGPELTAPEDDSIRTALSFGDLEAQREGTSAPAAAGGSGGTGGAAPRSATDDLFEQDKWLALAQFGLGLMSSQAPTLGQAIGEAGTTGIAALMQAREDRRDREIAAQTRADRLAATAARASGDEEAYPYRQIDDIINMAESYERRAASIVEENAGMAPVEGDPGYEDYINNLALANTYRNYAREAIGIQ